MSLKEKILIGYSILWIAATLITIISKCILIKKAGRRWWFGLIPVVRECQQLSIAWKRRWLPVFLIAEAFLCFIEELGKVFINDYTNIIRVLISPVLMYTLAIICAVYFTFMLTLNINMALHFKKNEAFGVVMTFLPWICYPIIAFGKAEYTKEIKKWMFII